MAVEIEAKMKVDDFDPVRRRLDECGARRLGAVLETNTFFDTADGSLVSADKGLRLRKTRDDATGGERFVITFKGPQQQGPFKSREEAEMNVTDGSDAAAVLKAMGYDPTLSFEKRRESWELLDCKVELDEVPILGRFVEIEGPGPQAVSRVREQLQLSHLTPIKTGYVTMLSTHLRDRNDPRRSITF